MVVLEISQIIGVPMDQVRIALAQLYSLLLSFILFKIKNIIIRKYYSLVFGTLLQFYVYKDQLFQYLFLFIQIACVYFICSKFRKKCGSIVTVLSILLVSGCHIHRMITAYGLWEIEISTLIMITVCKLSLFAYQYQDGAKISEGSLNQQQQNKTLVVLPSFYEYICFIQFLPTSVLGPSMDFIDYSQFINCQNHYKQIPSTYFIVLKTFLQCCGCFLIYEFIYLSYFPISFMNTNGYLQLDGLTMMIYSFVSVTLIRFKYYFAWKLNSCSLHACGISYSGPEFDETSKNKNLFKKHLNININIVESTYNVRQKIANWNISVQTWLRRSIYQRVGSYAQFCTYMISAFWHGFYGGYYIAFFLWFILLYLSQLIFKITRNYPQVQNAFQMTGFIGKAFLWLFVNVIFNNIGSCFVLLTSSINIKILLSMNFFPVLVTVIPTIILYFSGLWKKKPLQNKGRKQKE